MVINSLALSVSVIIPTFNRCSDLSRCLDSLVDQTRTDFEVLVCDDGSIDNTFQVFQGYLHCLNIHFLPGPNSGGPAAPRNRGLRRSLSKYVAFLDSDDWWHPKMIELSLACLQKGYDVTYSNGFRCSSSSNVVGQLNSRSLLKRNVYRDLFVRGNTLTTSSVFVRRSCFDKIGLFNELHVYLAWEDYDMWLRLAREGFRFKLISERLCFYSVSEDSISIAHSWAVMSAISRLVYNTSLPYSCPILSGPPAWFYYQSGLLSFPESTRRATFFYFISMIKSFLFPQPLLFSKSVFRILALVSSRR